MIDREKIKEGLLVWWQVPGVVTVVTKEYFKIRCFDNFEESAPLSFSEDNRWEKVINTCSLDDVFDYLARREVSLEKEAIQKQKESTTAKRKLQVFKNKSEALRKKYTV